MSVIPNDKPQIVDIAGRLFEEHGYDETSLSDIADYMHIPLELLERDYGCKDDLALAIYQSLSQASLAEVTTLPEGTISERYFMVLEDKLRKISTHEEAISALFASAMRPNSAVKASDISSGLDDPMMLVMRQTVEQATDRPTKDEDELILFLYSFHFVTIIFWLYDRTNEKQATHLFTNFMRDLVKVMRPMMVMPMVTKSLNKISKLMMVTFGGAKIVDSPRTDAAD